MKNIVYLIAISGIFILICYNCETTRDDKTENDLSTTLTGSLIHHTECKIFKTSFCDDEIPDTLSCIHYTYNEAEHTLTLRHINAGFNCCPDSLYCEISENPDTIIIYEYEKEAGCWCNCLFDLDIVIEGVDSKQYFLKFVEPYAGDLEKLFFEINPDEESEGMFCVTRKIYPWGTVDYEQEPPLELTGEIISHSNCKNFKTSEGENETPDTLSCIEYSFDVLQKELILKHINAGFNCCPESLYCEVSVHHDTIIVQEFEQDGLCDCLCLFDLNMKLEGVEPGKYYLKIIESYVDNEDMLNFELDLISNYGDTWCVIRKFYPWGL